MEEKKEWNLELKINVIVKARNEKEAREAFLELDYDIKHPNIIDSEILDYSLEEAS